MGAIVSKRRKKQFRVLLLGLDAAGKTVILYHCLLGSQRYMENTFGFSVETVVYNDQKMTIWEVAGNDKVRPLWYHYYYNTEGIIYVIDSNDRERLQKEVKHALYENILSHHDIQSNPNSPLLIFCNKQDLPNAMSVDEICLSLDLWETCNATKYQNINKIISNDILNIIFSYLPEHKTELNGRPIHVEGCCAVRTEGIGNGMDWFIDKMRITKRKRK